MRNKILPALVISFLILTGCAAAQTPTPTPEQTPTQMPVADKLQIQFIEFYSPF